MKKKEKFSTQTEVKLNYSQTDLFYNKNKPINLAEGITVNLSGIDVPLNSTYCIGEICCVTHCWHDTITGKIQCHTVCIKNGKVITNKFVTI